jgi:hypothetical protein
MDLIVGNEYMGDLLSRIYCLEAVVLKGYYANALSKNDVVEATFRIGKIMNFIVDMGVLEPTEKTIEKCENLIEETDALLLTWASFIELTLGDINHFDKMISQESVFVDTFSDLLYTQKRDV